MNRRSLRWRLGAVPLALVAAVLVLACARLAQESAGAAVPAGAAPAAAPAGQAPTAPPALVPLRLGLNTPFATIAPVWVAKDEGFFARQGLDVELVSITGAERLVAAVIAGELPLTMLAATALVNSVVGGSDLVFVASNSNQLRTWLYARPEYASVPELRGKKLAITGRAGIIRRATDLAFEHHGMDAERDATLVSVGNLQDSTTALLAGAVDAAMLQAPGTFLAEDAGMRLLVDTTDYHYPLISSGLAGSRAWIARNEELTRRTLMALAEGLAFARQERARTMQVIGKYSQTDDPVMLQRIYAGVAPGWERVPYAPPEAIRAELEGLAAENPAARDLRPEQFVDNRFVDELVASGFVDGLYR